MSRPLSRKEKVEQLVQMGFNEKDVKNALLGCQWNVEHAANRLAQGVKTDSQRPVQPQPPQPQPSPSLLPVVTNWGAALSNANNAHIAAPAANSGASSSSSAQPNHNHNNAGDELQRGVVKNVREGFGFIRRQFGPDVFFPFSAVVPPGTSVNIGDQVEFIEGPNKRDPTKRIGHQVRVIGANPAHASTTSFHLPAASKQTLPTSSTVLRPGGLLGKIVWLQPKYGLIHEQSKQQLFFFFTATFQGTERPERGHIAEFLPAREPVVGLTAKQVKLLDAREPAENDLIRDEIFSKEEDRVTEFKALTNSNRPGSSQYLQEICSKYVNAFLNSEGGVLYIGITDDGTIKGIPVSRKERDLFRLFMDSEMKGSRPAVNTDLYQINFLPVHRRVYGRWNYVEQIQDFCIIAIEVKKGTESFYQTKNTNKSYARRDGSIQELTPEMIKARVEKESQMKEQDLKQMVLKILESQGVTGIAGIAGIAGATAQLQGQPQPRAQSGGISIPFKLVEDFVSMGFQRAPVLDCIYKLTEEGVEEPSYEHVIARLAQPNDSSQPANLTSSAARSDQEQQTAPSSSSSSAASSSSSSSNDNLTQSQAAVAPPSLSADADLLPCQFCPILLPREKLMSHQTKCAQRDRLDSIQI
eukprot:g8428.t1